MNETQKPNFAQLMRWSVIILICAYGLKQALGASAPLNPPEPSQMLTPQITPSVQHPNRVASEDFHFINATPFLINVQYETLQGVMATQPVNANSSYLVRRKPASVTVYSREGANPTPITPDMIVNGTVTIKQEIPLQPQPLPSMEVLPTAPQQAPILAPSPISPGPVPSPVPISPQPQLMLTPGLTPAA